MKLGTPTDWQNFVLLKSLDELEKSNILVTRIAADHQIQIKKFRPKERNFPKHDLYKQ